MRTVRHRRAGALLVVIGPGRGVFCPGTADAVGAFARAGRGHVVALARRAWNGISFRNLAKSKIGGG